ncbi:14 kDa phosphohistidine phosphatase-like [Diorhabda carinulata]|uniref:14 kDa phosphohistidine phosphatase-like n=1 Tax=Diorhabda sublineata TaxID=1163346 RepID=UPI0024E0F612|nr:14 kDa phosphohistidine phosphatase-like [Diorhabda sublineata]XP_057657996.1 14 kDa phosphohistidine phosphatase-like [Diorhabda carinulata]
MASGVIPEIKNVDIDPSGVFKYILIKVSSPNSSGKMEDKLIVRGYAECPYHADINDKVTSDLQKLKSSKVIQDWRTKVLGGGRIQHDPQDNKILVYGYSQGYGKADHQLTVDILKTAYPNYDITFSDEGY